MILNVLIAAAAAIVLLLLVAGKVPLRYNLRNLTARWKTTVLTALAFTAVVGLLTVMLAFVHGMQRLTAASGQPGNVLVLAEGSTDEAFSKLGIGDLTEIENLSQVEIDPAGGRLASRETYLVVNQPISHPTPGRPNRRFLQLRGIDNPLVAARVHEVKLLPRGQWFSEAGAEELPGAGGSSAKATAVQAVLGEGVARELARDRSPNQLAGARNRERLDVGETFILGERTWVVVGVMDSASSTFGSEIWAKRSLIGPLFGKDAVTSLVLRARDVSTAETLRDRINKDYRQAASAQLETDYYANLSEMNQQFLWAITVVTIVMAIGGVFGVMNTMFAAISHRIKDVGVLRLLGFARWQIVVSFLLESLVIALVGGLVGCALGTLTHGWTATSVVTGHSGGGKFVVFQLIVSTQILAVGILVSLIMGVLGGLLPALSAMRLRPLEALR